MDLVFNLPDTDLFLDFYKLVRLNGIAFVLLGPTGHRTFWYVCTLGETRVASSVRLQNHLTPKASVDATKVTSGGP